MSGIIFNINNLKAVQDSFGKITDNVQEKVNASLAAFGNDVVSDAKRLCPVDEGNLRNSITFVQDDLSVTINVNANYAAYVEFGTRSFAQEYVGGLPETWQEFASQFQGSAGGSFQDFILIIKEWVERKGLTLQPQGQEYDSESGLTITHAPKRNSKGKQEADLDELAYLIARKIVTKGIPAQPFLYPAFEANRIELLNEIKNIFA